MSAVTWLCVLGFALAVVAIGFGYVSVGVFAVVLNPILAWYDWYEFGAPSDTHHWWNRFGQSPPDDPGAGGSKVPAGLPPHPNAPAGAQALPLPDED